jgi:hypothetical protein
VVPLAVPGQPLRVPGEPLELPSNRVPGPEPLVSSEKPERVLDQAAIRDGQADWMRVVLREERRALRSIDDRDRWPHRCYWGQSNYCRCCRQNQNCRCWPLPRRRYPP